jgi:hypothetical protein
MDYNPNASGDYTFIDRNAAALPTKFIYYRIKTLDKNNQVQYSKIVSLLTENENQILVYPNLVKKGEKVTIYNNTASRERYSYKLVNMQGATIMEKTNMENNSTTIATEKMAPGTYILQLNMSLQTFVYKIVVQ